MGLPLVLTNFAMIVKSPEHLSATFAFGPILQDAFFFYQNLLLSSYFKLLRHAEAWRGFGSDNYGLVTAIVELF